MSRTLNFTLLDDGNVLVEFNDVVTKHTMSMPAEDMRTCPLIEQFINSTKNARRLEDLVRRDLQKSLRGYNDV